MSIKTENNLLKYVANVLIATLISLLGSYLVFARQIATKDDVHQIIQQEGAVVAQRVDVLDQRSKKIELVLERNTEAFNALAIQMAELRKTMEFIIRDHEARNRP